MSWLNTASIASLAKSALKEAQKTIDKALDIKDNVTITNPTNSAALGKEIENFFESFGLVKDEVDDPGSIGEVSPEEDEVVVSEPSSKTDKTDSVSVWNSFTASFFDSNQKSQDSVDLSVPILDSIVASDDSTFFQQHSITVVQQDNDSSSIMVGMEVPAFQPEELGQDIVDLQNEQKKYISSDMFSSYGSLHEDTPLHCSIAEVADSKIRHSVSTLGEEESNSIAESFHSSISASSSVTVISPENEELSESLMRIENQSCSIQLLPCELNDDAGSSSLEVSTMLSEAMRDSIKTENSASVSGDEIETTNSSDIEIIASPQAGIRKVIQSRHMGGSNSMTHHREPSEASSEDSVTSGLDIDRMGRKVAELNQLLEVRENKLLELNRNCVALTDEIEELKTRLANDGKERLALGEAVRRQTEDFAQRLSSVEKRYQQVLAERNGLLAQLETAKNFEELSQQLKEKDEVIQELREEGEKLSRQHLQQSNIIKKLRAKEKDDELQAKQSKEKNEELNREIDRLKKALVVKEEMERNQIEAVKQLTAANNQLEKELIANKVVTRDSCLEVDTLRAALAETKKELEEARNNAAARDSAETERNLSVEVSLRQQLQLEFETSTRIFEEENHSLKLRCQELVHTLATADAERSKEKEQTKNEISRLMQRLQEAEARSDELSQALTTATRPLLRQIDNLQLALSSQRMAEEKSENLLEDKLNTIQLQLEAALQKEAAMKNKYSTLQSQVDDLSQQCNAVSEEKQQLVTQLTQEKSHSQNLQQEVEKVTLSLQVTKKELGDEVQALKRKLLNLERSYELQTNAIEEEKRKSNNLLERLHERDLSSKVLPSETQIPGNSGIVRTLTTSESCVTLTSRSSSPTPSLGKLSLSGSFTESHSSNPWISTDEVFDGGLATPVPRPTLYDTMRAGSYTAVFESLQSQLKTRDGEVVQLQQELQSQERTRDSLAQELAQMINSNQELNRRLEQLDQLQLEFGDLKTKYNALLQMYGEKMEENEELRLDLLDVKDLYRKQIDQLMKT